jgi:hypothetical protein
MDLQEYMDFLEFEREMARVITQEAAETYAHATYCLKNAEPAYQNFMVAIYRLLGEGMNSRRLNLVTARVNKGVPKEWTSTWVVVRNDAPVIRRSLQEPGGMRLFDPSHTPIQCFGHGPSEVMAWNSALIHMGIKPEVTHGPR